MVAECRSWLPSADHGCRVQIRVAEYNAILESLDEDHGCRVQIMVAAVNHGSVGEKLTVSGKLIRICRRLASEMLLAGCVLPWCYSDLRLRTDETVSATDASGSAGGISRSVRLSKAGMEALKTRSDRGYQCCSEEFAILSWFDGIGAIRQAWDMLQLPLGGYFSCEIERTAIRVVSSRWPHAVNLGDIRELSRDKFKELRASHPKVKHLLRVGGFPCQDLSLLMAGRQGLRGTRSGLVYVMLEKEQLVDETWTGVASYNLWENVWSMSRNARRQLSSELKAKPLKICSSMVTDCRRPRLLWLRNIQMLSDGETKVIEKPEWYELESSFIKLEPSRWLSRGWSWPGASQGQCFATFVKPIPRKRPPPFPAGVESCDRETLMRWKDNCFRFPPYQYKLENIVYCPRRGFRVLSATEREVMMFFPKNYTVAATASSLEKTNPQAMFDARASLLGNTMEILTMSWVLSRLAVKLGYLHQTPTMSEIAHGEVWKYHVVSGPVSQKSRVLKKYLKPENQMVWWVMFHADNRGSDVRLDAGTLLRPDRIQRTSINSAHWI